MQFTNLKQNDNKKPNLIVQKRSAWVEYLYNKESDTSKQFSQKTLIAMRDNVIEDINNPSL